VPYPTPGPLFRWLPIIRLATVFLLLSLGLYLNQARLLTVHLIPFLGSLTAAAVVSLTALALAQRKLRVERFVWGQLTLDVMVVTALVTSTGGARSLFASLYVPVIIAASLLLSPKGSLWVAAFSSILYAGSVLIPPYLFSTSLSEFIDPDGLLVLTLVSHSTVFFLVALLGTVLTQRLQKAHRALSVQQENFDDLQAFNALLLQSMGAGLVAIDRKGTITAFNRAAEEISGFDASEMIGQPFEFFFGPEIHFGEVWDDATRQGSRQSRRFETHIRRKDGRDVPLGISFSPLLSGKGHLVGVIGICRDLTEIKRADRQIRLADRLATVGRLAGNIAHEIRNPLASLSGAIELLAKERTDDETSGRLMEIVLRESDRLNRTIMNFLEYARPDPLHRCPSNLAEILEEVLILIERRPQLPATVRVVREYPPNLPVQLDPQQVRQAFWNLCLNAVEAMPEGGELRVGAQQVQRSGGSWVEVWVSDTGHGIPSEDLPNVLEPFFTTKPQGSGLGLALAHRMVQDHGGEIEVRSEISKGTTVLLLLPQESAVLTA